MCGSPFSADSLIAQFGSIDERRVLNECGLDTAGGEWDRSQRAELGWSGPRGVPWLSCHRGR
jgi:hypothetical protein